MLTGAAMGSTVPGEIRPQDTSNELDTVNIPITGVQALILNQEIQAEEVLPSDYTVGRPSPAVDCSSWVQGILGNVVLIQALRRRCHPSGCSNCTHFKLHTLKE